jgi:hypothetical protein
VIPKRDCPIVTNGYMMELVGYGRLCGSTELHDLLTMARTLGYKPGTSRIRLYRHVVWADHREWTKRIEDPEPIIRRALMRIA